MAPIILVSGGVRSGKSVRAETLTLSYPGRPVYVATAEPFDAEFAARIDSHRQRRGADWELREAPVDLASHLRDSDGAGARLVDCLTVWLSNLLHHGHDWRQAAGGVRDELKRQRSPVVLVTSEVGLGLIPDNRLGREFLDAAGTLNQWIASDATHVEFVAMGLPLRLK